MMARCALRARIDFLSASQIATFRQPGIFTVEIPDGPGFLKLPHYRWNKRGGSRRRFGCQFCQRSALSVWHPRQRLVFDPLDEFCERVPAMECARFWKP